MLATGLQLERMKTVTDDIMNASVSVYLQNCPCTPRNSFSKSIIHVDCKKCHETLLYRETLSSMWIASYSMRQKNVNDFWVG